MLDWNDLRHFLAVAGSGSTLAAGRALGVSQSTAARRVAALEAALGLELFEKTPAGYLPTEAAAELLQAAKGVEAAAELFENKAAAKKRGLSGVVRLTTNEAFATGFLLRAMRDFHAAYPGICLDVITSDRHLNLEAGEADVALRVGPRPTRPDLAGRRIATESWSVYCSRAYAATRGTPRCPAEVAGHVFIGTDMLPPAGPFTAWIAANVPAEAILLRPSSVSAVFAAIRAGLGLGLMSDFVAAGDADLIRCFDTEIEPFYEIWLLADARRRNTPQIRAVLDYLSGYFASGLHGRGPG